MSVSVPIECAHTAFCSTGSADGVVLAVQLWTMNNYHYYLKQELFPPGANRFSSLQWHPEKALTLYLGASSQCRLTVVRSAPL
jgi:hypothetical protein